MARRLGLLTPINGILTLSTMCLGSVGTALLFKPERLPTSMSEIVCGLHQSQDVGYFLAQVAGCALVCMSIMSALTLVGPKPASVTNIFTLAAFFAGTTFLQTLPSARFLQPPWYGVALTGGLALLLFGCLFTGSMGSPHSLPVGSPHRARTKSH